MTQAPAAPTTTHAPAGGARRVTRDDILALARRGRHYEFIPLALRLLQQIPHDHATRLVVATSYARLGLRTPTLQHLDALPPELQSDQSVLALRAALQAFPLDEVPLHARTAQCDANLHLLKSRGLDLTTARAAWLNATGRERWFRTRDANIVRRALDAAPDQPWLHFRDDRAEAAAFPLPHLASPGASPRPYTLEGFFPPWLAQRVHQATPAAADGYRTRITIVQEDPLEFLDGLASADLRDMLGDDRVELHVGAGAGGRYRASLDARTATRAAGPGITLASLRRPATPSVARTLADFAEAQTREHRELEARARELYAHRDAAWWRARYASPTEPLRVLVPTCRYSTFVRHSAADIADAFAHAGWQSRILIEPDDTSHLSSIAYLRELVDFQPDLVVLINYTRRGIGDFIPAQLPFICWLQDAMPHQFDAALAAAMGPFDFLAGYLHRELFEQFGFERRRCAVFPVAVSARKFHAAAPTSSQRERLACDVAYVSHHSETPDAMHDRLVREASREPLAARIFQELRVPVRDIARDAMGRLPAIELRLAAQEVARRVLGAEPPDATITLVTRQYCFPMADRVIRHETLAWAADLAARRGWRLHIHGRGWETHPTLAPFARGELAHDDELRASYHCSGVHLHASSNWLLHQRIMECALAGGLPLVRLKKSDLVQWEHAVAQRLAHDAPIVMERRTPLLYREHGYAVADHPMAMEYAAQLQRLDIEAPWDLWMHGRRYDEFRATPPEALEPAAGSVLGDLASTTFRTPAELELLIERALNDCAWREATSRMVASRVSARYTTDVIARRMHDMVARELGA